MVARRPVSRGPLLPAERHPGAAAAAARSARRHPAARPALSRQVLRDAAQRQPVTVSQEAMRRLMAYAWPGNVRQLENAIERAVAFGGGRGADRRRRSAARTGAPRADAAAGGGRAARRRPRSRRVRRQHRARADPAVARADRRQQGSGRAPAPPEAHDARRKTEAVATTDAAPLRLLDDSDRRQADGVSRARSRGTAADLQSARAQERRHRAEVLLRAAGCGTRPNRRSGRRATSRRRRRGKNATATGVRAASTRIRAPALPRKRKSPGEWR